MGYTYECTICGQGCGSKNHLEKHIAQVHEKQRPFQCEICGSSFFSKEHVKRHVLAVHEKKKSYNCHLCNVSFAAKGNLKAHILSVHEGIKNIKKVNQNQRASQMRSLKMENLMPDIK